MKNIILKILILIFFLTLLLITYLSTIGIETKRLNHQIIEKIEKFNENIEVDLKAIKIVLDPIKLQLNTKTIGTELKIKNKKIEIENIKSKISIKSLIKDKFSVKNLDISTKSLKIKNLISFLRNYENKPELYILEKVFQKGFLVTTIKLEFDEQGKIKENYKLSGLIKDAEINTFQKYNLKKLNLLFDFENQNLVIKDISFNLIDIPIFSEKISIKKRGKDKLFVKGSLENKDIIIEGDVLRGVINNFKSNFKIKNINLNSKNNFSFYLIDKFRVDDLKLNSKIELKSVKLLNNFELKNFFPQIKNEIEFLNHSININFDDKNLNIKGNGKINLQKKNDKINYEIEKNKDKFDFKIISEIEDNPLSINFLNYKKKVDSKAKLEISGSYFSNKNIVIKLLT